MNINGVAVQTSGLLNVNRGLDNTQRVAGDLQGSGKPDTPEVQAGQPLSASVQETAAAQQVAAPTTQVVNQADEVMGSLIDTRV
ncbi:hypothetical protein [Nitrincola tapanii]|uniref:Uncharacterized protein n=1 Tax=Nitrincola tapanii TaxID=1708751 RepID=A0A5A9W0X9_9GAMM|nr:hypothetical protein [Nitrincola tapanii]KAA0873879.1 hypothetical protein E1H14_11015 [Nitrincola tapanii]